MANFKINTSKQLAAAADYLDCLTLSEQRTFSILASYANLRNDIHCFPAYTTIAKAANKSLRTIKYHIAKLAKLGLVLVSNARGYYANSGKWAQKTNRYVFDIDRVLELIKVKETQLTKLSKSKLHSDPALDEQTISLTDTKDIRSSHADPVSEISREEKLLAEAKEQLNKLKQVRIFKNKQEAWASKGRRYFCNTTGGLFVHKSHIDKPWLCLGFVVGSQAHSDVLYYVREIETAIKLLSTHV